MTASSGAPGWYPDPSGLPGTFRWWDGRTWTSGLTTNPQAPPPRSLAAGGGPQQPPTPPGPLHHGPPPGPATPPGPYGPGPGPTGPVPPPPGAPGPGYVAPPEWNAGSGTATEVLSSEPENGNPNRTPLIIVLVALVVLGLVGGGTYFLFLRDDSEQTAASESASDDRSAEPSDEPTDGDIGAEDGQPADQQPDPSESAGGSKDEDHSEGQAEGDAEGDTGREPPSDEQQPNPDPMAGPALEYEPLGGPWATARIDHIMSPGTGIGQSVVTEPNYDGNGANWQALVAVGIARPEWVVSGDPKQTAYRAAGWFATDGFGPVEVTPEVLDEEPTTVDGYDAYVLKQQFTFSAPDLEATTETVYVVAVDFGDTAGIFLASIPGTHEELVADADRALDSLRVVE